MRNSLARSRSTRNPVVSGRRRESPTTEPVSCSRSAPPCTPRHHRTSPPTRPCAAQFSASNASRRHQFRVVRAQRHQEEWGLSSDVSALQDRAVPRTVAGYTFVDAGHASRRLPLALTLIFPLLRNSLMPRHGCIHRGPGARFEETTVHRTRKMSDMPACSSHWEARQDGGIARQQRLRRVWRFWRLGSYGGRAKAGAVQPCHTGLEPPPR